MNTLTLKSFAKVNLFLRVISKRKDGFHNLDTIFERINLFDTLKIRLREDNKINIICAHPKVPLGSSNLCFKAAHAIRECAGINQGVDITITKRIPVAAGLGGGSSNAAGVLLGLNRLLKLNFPLSRLQSLGDSIGSDIAFFLYDISFARGKERGNSITPLNALARLKLWQVLVVPNFSVSTAEIFANLSRFSLLTRQKTNVRINHLQLRGDPAKFPFFNTLEAVSIRLYPEIGRIKKSLALLGLKTMLMSGSGPAVLSLVSSRKEAVAIARQLSSKHNSWQSFAVSTA